MASKFHPVVGERFGRYTVISVEPPGKHYQTRVKCKCDCGTIKIVDYSHLVNKRIISCGCYGKEKRIEAIKNKSAKFHNEYHVEGDIVCMKASNSENVFLVDVNQLDTIINHRWFVGGNGYIFTKINHRVVFLHRYLLGMDHDDNRVVDHINCNPLDNRLINLRICEQVNNCMNRNPCKTKLHSKYKGVFSATNGKTFFSSIQKDGKAYYLGTFETEEEAAIAYDKKAIEFFGEYAKTNMHYN